MNKPNQRGGMSRKPKPIAQIIESAMGSLGLRDRYHGWLIVQQWPDIVGRHVARRSYAVRYDEGTLYIAVADAVWRQELAMQAENILKEIHNLPHGRVVKKLRLIHGMKGT